MSNITTIELIERMDREIKSIERDIDEALKIDNYEDRQLKLEELFNERDIVTRFYRDMITTVMAQETMSVTTDGQLKIN